VLPLPPLQRAQPELAVLVAHQAGELASASFCVAASPLARLAGNIKKLAEDHMRGDYEFGQQQPRERRLPDRQMATWASEGSNV
jgi:hypothetical protein